jgi:hypothetical protein
LQGLGPAGAGKGCAGDSAFPDLLGRRPVLAPPICRTAYQSGFTAGTGRYSGLLCERFFPYVFFHKLTASSDGLRWELVRWKLLFLPVPRWLMPIAVCIESGEGDHFVFDIDAAFRIVGPVVHYHGWLAQK